MNNKVLEQAKALPRKAGKAEYLRHLKGKHLTRGAAIKAKCFECVGGEDTAPCTVQQCALTPYCQWNKEGATVEAETLEGNVL